MRSSMMMLLACAICAFALAEVCFMVYSSCVALICTYCWPYMKTSSPHIRLNKSIGLTLPTAKRRFAEAIMYTSLIYGVAAVCALYWNQYCMTFLCATTCLSSLCYHRAKEGKYFNFDNIFATSLLFIYFWSIIHSYWNHDLYFNLGLLGIPTASFLISFCGMPAEITLETVTGCCIRSDRPFYNLVHSIWHLASGLGVILSVWYFSEHDAVTAESRSSVLTDLFHHGDVVMGCTLYVDPFGWFPLIPTMSFIFASTINVLGNYFGIMPMP